MKNSNNREPKNRLFLFVVISLIIHFGMFYLLPWGGFATGLNPEGRAQEDFEFVQVIDFETVPGESGDEDITEETEEIEREEAEEEIEDPEPSQEVPSEDVEETVEEDIPAEDETEEVAEAQEEPEETEEISEDDVEREEEVMTAEEAEEEIEVPEEEHHEETEAAEAQEAAEEETEADEAQVEETDTGGEDDTPPPAGELVLHSEIPVYPKYAVGPGETGEVVVSAFVDTAGEVEEIQIAESSGNEAMDRNAQNTIEHGWDFSSYSSSYTMEIFVNYDVDERGNPDVNYELLEVKFN